MQYLTDNTRIKGLLEVTPPIKLIDKLPLSSKASKLVYESRNELSSILKQEDDRLLVVVGPCSIHDPKAAIEYAKKLKPLADDLSKELKIVMRVYFEKPRTTIGWKGLINDPRLDNSFKINEGLRISRKLLKDIADLGVPTGTEFLDLISPQYVSDLVCWGAIGARTAESQVHRELTSGLSCPIGIKNSTKGDIQIAIDAIKSAQYQHVFLGTTKKGKVAIFKTSGNDDTHIILRGGLEPNYHPKDIENCRADLEKNEVNANIMVDFSHGNSQKNHENQKKVSASICDQIASGNKDIIGVMIESHLKEGNQKISEDMEYGKSVTDACVNWEETKKILDDLAEAVKARR